MVTEVEMMVAVVMVTNLTKDEVKNQHFQGHLVEVPLNRMDPLRSGQIADQGGLLVDMATAQEIIEGTFVPPEVTDTHLTVMLKILYKFEATIKAGPTKQVITRDYLMEYWRQAWEKM